jgi:hypothetical protein
VDVSFEHLITTLDAGLRHGPTGAAPPAPVPG